MPQSVGARAKWPKNALDGASDKRRCVRVRYSNTLTIINIYVNKMAEIDNPMLAELEQESRLMRARNARLEAEVTVLTEMVRVLSDKLAQMEAKNE